MSKLPLMELAIGMAVGLGWGYGKQFLEKKGVLTGQLNPKPEAFDIDPCLHELFVDLSALADVDKEAFGRAVEDTDRILLLEKQLRSKATYPLCGDVSRLYVHRRRLCLEFQILITKCTDARQQSLMKRIIMDILDRVNQHYNCVYSLCERLRAEDIYDYQ